MGYSKFLPEARLFWCPRCRHTFRVTDEEYREAHEKHAAQRPIVSVRHNVELCVVPSFELCGHEDWVYRYDEDYTEYMKEAADDKTAGAECPRGIG